jgi:protein-tyrosine phosphatase
MEHMEVIAPAHTDKMHTLLGYLDGVAGEPVDGRYDVRDPFERGMDEYRACAAQLEDAINRLANRLEREMAD